MKNLKLAFKATVYDIFRDKGWIKTKTVVVFIVTFICIFTITEGIVIELLHFIPYKASNFVPIIFFILFSSDAIGCLLLAGKFSTNYYNACDGLLVEDI